MNRSHFRSEEQLAVGIGIAAVIVLLGFLCLSIAGRYLGFSRKQGLWVALLSIVSSMFCGWHIYGQLYNSARVMGPFGHTIPWSKVAFAIILPMVALPFVIRLYLKWIEGRLTDAEKVPGMEGVRAWLRGGNMICALLISLCAWQGFGLSFYAVLALTLMALVAYPILNLASTSPAPAVSDKEDLSGERERVLKMLDAGRISAQESAELLNALGHTVQPRTPQSTVPGHQKMVLVGLILLLIGFFLPWFTYNPGQEMNRLMGELQQGIPENMPGSFKVQMPPGMQLSSVSIPGGGIKYGLGWLVLLFGIGAAALPYLAENLSVVSRQKATLVGLGVGAIILVYLLTLNMRYVSVGILLAIAGYVFQFVGALKDRQPA